MTEKPFKWVYEVTEEELRSYPLDRIKVGIDRVECRWITADEVVFVRLPDLNRQGNKEYQR